MKEITCMLFTLLLTGCDSLNRSLLFYTQTNVGIEVGVDPAQQSGKVLIGYKRAEGVVNPVYIPPEKTTEHEKDECGNITKTTITRAGGEADKVYRKEAYSVMAKIAGEANGRGSTGQAGEVEAAGKIAQWFATGEAANHLAKNEYAAAALTGSSETAKAIADSPKLGSKFSGNVIGMDTLSTFTIAINDLSNETEGSESGKKAIEKLNAAIVPYLRDLGSQSYFKRSPATQTVAVTGKWTYDPNAAAQPIEQWISLQAHLTNARNEVENLLSQSALSFQPDGAAAASKIYTVDAAGNVAIDATLMAKAMAAIEEIDTRRADQAKQFSDDENLIEAVVEVMDAWIELFRGSES
jgi:hypothetical protein